MATTVANGEAIIVQDRKYRAVKEGLAQILAPYREQATTTNKGLSGAKSHNNDEGDQAVFYNPIQQYNRDLSVLAILTYGEGALAEKEAILTKRDKGKRNRRQRKKAQVEETKVNEEEPKAAEVSKKRKADELEEPVRQTNVDEKKLKIGHQLEDEESGLEIQQLEVDDEVEIVTMLPEQSNSVSTTRKTDNRDSTQQRVEFTILDALSASGLRAIRYAKEIPFATNIIANDLSGEAVKAIELNIDHNKLQGKVHSNVGDARAYMYSKIGNEYKSSPAGKINRFDVIDLDPYGTAAPFLDAAVQALADGGLLCVTCTDAGVFASNGYPEKAYALYSGTPMKGSFSHETGLRLILHAVATSAAKYGIAIEPLLSLSIDFYARLFIRVHKSAHQVKVLAGTTMVTYSCDFGCGAWNTQLLARNQEKMDKIGETIFKHSFAQGPSTKQFCEHCGTKMHLGGPMWAGPLHNPYFVQKILDKIPDLDTDTYQTTDRVRGMLTLALEEDLTLTTSIARSASAEIPEGTPTDSKLIPRLPPQTIDATPFFFIPNYLAKVLHCATPPEDQIRGAIRHLGYKVTRSHCKAGSFKTNAPWDVLWEIMREWVRRCAPVKEGKITKGMAGWRIMQKTRGTEMKNVMDIQENLRRVLERGLDGKEELKTLCESGLYRLERLRTEVSDIDAENGDVTKDIGLPNGGETSSKSHRDEPRDVSRLKIVFDAELGKEKPRGRLVRYQINPRANWGPMNRAG